MTRLQVRLSGAAERIFERLVKDLDLEPKEVVLDALAILHYAAGQVRDGRKIGSYDPDAKEFTALTTPTLEALAESVEAAEVPQAEMAAAEVARHAALEREQDHA